MNEQKTSIDVKSSDPPPQPVQQDDPFGLIVGNVSGHRDDDAQSDWTAHEVSPSNYQQFLEKAEPRFCGTVPDHLSGKANSVLAVDVTFAQTTPNWSSEIDEKVTEIAQVNELIRDVERLKRYLSQQPAVRNRLEHLLGTAVSGGN